ncbi:gallidermin family lantibiotic [Alteribacillus sp. HJP-4]
MTNDIFDLDVEVTKSQPQNDAEPQITSVSLCTPGCGETGSFNSYCC